jgi:hypothetical protein
MESMMPRKQRKELFNAPLHKRRKWISSHLEEKLLLKYDKLLVNSDFGMVLPRQKNKLRAFLDKGGRVLLYGNEAMTVLPGDMKASEDTKQFVETYIRARSLKRFEGKGKRRYAMGDKGKKDKTRVGNRR